MRETGTSRDGMGCGHFRISAAVLLAMVMTLPGGHRLQEAEPRPASRGEMEASFRSSTSSLRATLPTG